jgi:sulfur carrier protein ThiS
MESAMAPPAIRAKAMGPKDQDQVWSEVRKQRAKIAANLANGQAVAVNGTTSYARVMGDRAVQQQVDSVAEPIERSYQSLIGQLRVRNAVGVVVAVNGEIVWADIFASANLLKKYWPKLVRSYAAEAIVTKSGGREVGLKSAEEFLDNTEGLRETVENEPGLYRHTEIAGPGFTVFELTSLLPKTGFDLHVAKMAE